MKKNQSQIQIDLTKLDLIYDFCKDAELKGEGIKITYHQDGKPEVKLEFRFRSQTSESVYSEPGDFVVFYDGKFLILERTKNETKLHEIHLPMAIPSEFDRIKKCIAEAIYLNFQDDLFQLPVTNCTEVDDTFRMFEEWANCVSCELVYIDIEAEDLIAFRESLEIAKNEKCLDYLYENISSSRMTSFLRYLQRAELLYILA